MPILGAFRGQAASSWMEAFFHRIPYLLGVWVLLTSAALTDLVVTEFLLPSAQASKTPFSHPYLTKLVSGGLLLFLALFVKLMWLGSWLPCVWAWTHYDENKFVIQGTKRVMQSDPRTAEATVWNPRGHRPRLCGMCRTSVPLSDRVYHCLATGHHYTLYDHYCHWLCVVVYLETIKPYLLMLAFLALDVGTHFCTSVYAMAALDTSFHYRRYALPAVAMGAVFLAGLLVFDTFHRQWYWLALRNCTGAEGHGHRDLWVLVRTKTESDGLKAQFVWLDEVGDTLDDFCLSSRVPQELARLWPVGPIIKLLFPTPATPWSCSHVANLRAALGDSAWSWPWFWMVPRRVREYGKHEDADLPVGELWTRFETRMNRGGGGAWRFRTSAWFDPIARAEGSFDRRAVGRSTGVDIEMV